MPESKKTRKLECRDLMDERQDIMNEMYDLKGKLAITENRVKTRLINTGQTDLLSVNWSRLSRTLR